MYFLNNDQSFIDVIADFFVVYFNRQDCVLESKLLYDEHGFTIAGEPTGCSLNYDEEQSVKIKVFVYPDF